MFHNFEKVDSKKAKLNVIFNAFNGTELCQNVSHYVKSYTTGMVFSVPFHMLKNK
jgi:hypothetical protein